MPTRTNTQRAEEIRDLILPAYDDLDIRSSMIDVLTDLRHLADLQELDFYRLLDTSYDHYLYERKEEKV